MFDPTGDTSGGSIEQSSRDVIHLCFLLLSNGNEFLRGDTTTTTQTNFQTTDVINTQIMTPMTFK